MVNPLHIFDLQPLADGRFRAICLGQGDERLEVLISYDRAQRLANELSGILDMQFLTSAWSRLAKFQAVLEIAERDQMLIGMSSGDTRWTPDTEDGADSSDETGFSDDSVHGGEFMDQFRIPTNEGEFHNSYYSEMFGDDYQCFQANFLDHDRD
jgi:hypothetical protein